MTRPAGFERCAGLTGQHMVDGVRYEHTRCERSGASWLEVGGEWFYLCGECKPVVQRGGQSVTTRAGRPVRDLDYPPRAVE